MHIGLIMDGNRRWAKGRLLPAVAGHARGADTLEQLLDWCFASGIRTVSAWALAKKNIEERSEEELTHLYGILEERLPKLLGRLKEKGIRLIVVGKRALLPRSIQESIAASETETAPNTVGTLILGLGYGGQDETVRGAQAFAKYVLSLPTKEEQTQAIEALNENTFGMYLDSGSIAPPDLIIRTGGDIRHSGFLLYQSEYAEYAFTDTLWPDFTHSELEGMIEKFTKAKRNFGK